MKKETYEVKIECFNCKTVQPMTIEKGTSVLKHHKNSKIKDDTENDFICNCCGCMMYKFGVIKKGDQ